MEPSEYQWEPVGIFDPEKNTVVRFTLDQALDLFGDEPEAFCAYLTSGGLHDGETGVILRFTTQEAQAAYDEEYADLP